MNLLPDILNQAADRIAARRGATQPPARVAPPLVRRVAPVQGPLDDDAALTSLVLHEAAIKLAYVGHCGRPGKRGGSRPKSQCGALPMRAAGPGQLDRNSTSPNQYTVERSVEKRRGRPQERITRVIYEKRRNPEEQRTWLKDAAIDLGRATINTAPAAALAAGLWFAGKNVAIGLRAGPFSTTSDIPGRSAGAAAPGPTPGAPTPTKGWRRRIKDHFTGGGAPDVTPGVVTPDTDDLLRGPPTPPILPRPPRAPNGRIPRNGSRRPNGVTRPPNGNPVPPQPFVPPKPQTPPATPRPSTSQPRRRNPNNTLDRASESPVTSLPSNTPKTSPKKALDDLDTVLAGMKRNRKGVWTLKGNIRKPKGSQSYEATIENKKGRTQTVQWFWDGKKWAWRKKS